MSVTTQDIRAAAQALGLSGQAICIHASLRSFGQVEGGAPRIIAGLLAEGCTVMVPAFSWDVFAVAPLPHQLPERNGSTEEWRRHFESMTEPLPGVGRIYTPDAMDIDRADMGAVPAAVVAMSGRSRGNHPLCSFAAVGPLARELIAGQQPLNVFAPLKVLAEMNGAVVLMGVGLARMTFLHLAEQMAGRTLFRRWANGSDGQPMAVEAGSCSNGFGSFEPILLPLMKVATVGQSTWRVFPAKETLALTAQAIRNNPSMTHCANPACSRCHDAVRGGPIIRLPS